MNIHLPDILGLTVAKRIQLIEDIWDSIAAVPESLPLTEAEREELDRRLEMYAQSSDEIFNWNEFKAKVREFG